MCGHLQINRKNQIKHSHAIRWYSFGYRVVSPSCHFHPQKCHCRVKATYFGKPSVDTHEKSKVNSILQLYVHYNFNLLVLYCFLLCLSAFTATHHIAPVWLQTICIKTFLGSSSGKKYCLMMSRR